MAIIGGLLNIEEAIYSAPSPISPNRTPRYVVDSNSLGTSNNYVFSISTCITWPESSFTFLLLASKKYVGCFASWPSDAINEVRPDNLGRPKFWHCTILFSSMLARSIMSNSPKNLHKNKYFILRATRSDPNQTTNCYKKN